MQKIAIKDKQLEHNFGIEILGIIEDNGTITLKFFGKDEFRRHRDIIIKTDPLEKTGSGTITSDGLFDLKIKEFEDLSG